MSIPQLLAYGLQYGLPLLAGYAGNRQAKKRARRDESLWNEYYEQEKQSGLRAMREAAQEGTGRIRESYAGRGLYGSSGMGVSQQDMEGNLIKSYQELLSGLGQKRLEYQMEKQSREDERRRAFQQMLASYLTTLNVGGTKKAPTAVAATPGISATDKYLGQKAGEYSLPYPTRSYWRW